MTVLGKTYKMEFSGYDFLNFWLVGGLSALFLCSVAILRDYLPHDISYKASWWAYYAAFAVNYAHFAYSYQLFYESFSEHLRDPDSSLTAKIRFFISGVVVPVALVLYFFWTYLMQDAVLMGYGVSMMFFFVGWHYVKQGYGVLITLSVQKRIFYSMLTKKALMYNAYAVWAFSWLKVNSAMIHYKYYDIPYSMLEMPGWMIDTAFVVLCITTTLSVCCLIREWLVFKKNISINGLMGYISATYLWVIFPYINPVFLLFVPLFHSLQYMPFVYQYKLGEMHHRLENSGAEKEPPHRNPKARLAFFALAGLALGAIFMDLLPKQIDRVYASEHVIFSQNFFLVAFLLFINIHHYFIDHAFWRKDNKKVQAFLFRRG